MEQVVKALQMNTLPLILHLSLSLCYEYLIMFSVNLVKLTGIRLYFGFELFIHNLF